jgi:hypothetical protein
MDVEQQRGQVCVEIEYHDKSTPINSVLACTLGPLQKEVTMDHESQHTALLPCPFGHSTQTMFPLKGSHKSA